MRQLPVISNSNRVAGDAPRYRQIPPPAVVEARDVSVTAFPANRGSLLRCRVDNADRGIIDYGNGAHGSAVHGGRPRPAAGRTAIGTRCSRATPLVTPSPGSAHQGVAAQLSALFASHILARRLRLFSPGVVTLPPLTQLEPDLLVVPPRFAPGTPWAEISEHWLAVEIVSRSSRVYDREFKRDAYLALGVREVWLVDVRDRSIEVCVRRGAGRVIRESADVERAGRRRVGAHRLDGAVLGPGTRCSGRRMKCRSFAVLGLVVLVRDVVRAAAGVRGERLREPAIGPYDVARPGRWRNGRGRNASRLVGGTGGRTRRVDVVAGGVGQRPHRPGVTHRLRSFCATASLCRGGAHPVARRQRCHGGSPSVERDARRRPARRPCGSGPSRLRHDGATRRVHSRLGAGSTAAHRRAAPRGMRRRWRNRPRAPSPRQRERSSAGEERRRAACTTRWTAMSRRAGADGTGADRCGASERIRWSARHHRVHSVADTHPRALPRSRPRVRQSVDSIRGVVGLCRRWWRMRDA